MTADLNPRFSFDAFVVGAANQLAVTAARSVAESPGTAYNPLYIYSPTGLGKTHLLMAIGRHAMQLALETHVEYLTLDEFVEAYHAAVAAGQSDAFRNRFAAVDVLLVDDVQFLTNRRETQAELLRLMSHLQSEGKQVVLTSDRPPSELNDLDERLISRFDGGLVVDIGRPDYETRLAILRRRADERGSEFHSGVMEAAAGFELNNVRELLGLLNRLVAFQAVSEAPLTPDTARTLLEGEVPRGTGSGGAATARAAPDEFADFLSDVAHTVEEQVEAWRSALAKGAKRWKREGYRTARLAELLKQNVPASAEHVVREYERDIERLKGLQHAMKRIDPERADDAVFYDPDRVDEAVALVEDAERGLAPPPGPSLAWSFDGYVGGEANKVALNAAKAVLERPGKRYNPLVLVGSTGVGKTHLLHAIGHSLAARAKQRVACLSGQQLLDELVQAIDLDEVDRWRSRFRTVTAFLLDDVHLLAGKERSQEELFHLFNFLADARRQLVFTLLRPPSEVTGLDDRIVSRLEGGLVATVHPPDRDLRRLIVVRKLEERLGTADDELADYLAARPADSVRALLGVVQRVLGAADAQGMAPSAAQARDLIEGAAPPRRRPAAVRTSGVVVSPSGGVHSREKMVWLWPDPAERLIEELA